MDRSNLSRPPSYYDSSLEEDIATSARLLHSMEDQYSSPGYHSRSASLHSHDNDFYNSPRPSTPHRSSYNPHQGYELPPPATHSPSPSPTRRRMRDYLPFSPSRMGRERPLTATTQDTRDTRDDWARPPPTPRLYDQDTEYTSSDAPTPRPVTASSGYSMASSRRPLPAAPLYAIKNTSKSSKLNESVPILSPSSSRIDEEEEDPFSDGRRSEDSASTKIEPSLYGTEYPSTEYHDEKPLEEQVTKKGENYGPAPQGPLQRRGLNRQAIMTKKMVKLTGGELILECKIPTILYSFLPRRDDQEFTHMRYSAVTCDPDDFASRGFTLRQALPQTRRETELFVCITMYNEDEICFTRTMHGVMRNIAHFCSRSKSRVWGKDGWEKIVVCIVADGRKKTHPRVLDALAAMGVYQSGIAKNMVNGKQVNAHVYEYTTQVSLDSDLKFKGAEKGIVPVQMIFCLKEKNAKKLNSHRWFFNAFGSVLNPNVCILLDVGTKPGNDSLYHLWKAFDTDSNVGGACGEIKAMKGKGWLGLFNPLVASQNFEYKMSNILDKPLESVFGYITVLPGALSAYRYHALQNDATGNGPLSQYFKGEELHGKDADIFTANMYLAEDRILCWELVAKKHERWVLKYVRAAHGETDVPDTVPEFVSQRRRWLNGALFAALYSLIHFRQVWGTDHTVVRKILLHIEFFYQFVNLFFTYFSLANFYLTFYFISGSLCDEKLDPFGNGWGARIFTVLRISTVLLICTQFILSMGNRPQGAKRMFMWSMILSSLIMAYNTFCALYIVISTLAGSKVAVVSSIEIGDNVFTNLVVSTASTIGVYLLMSFLYLDPWHMFTSAFQYFMMLPSYIITLQVYAFCNTHDVSWGTKGDNVISTDLGVVVNKGDMAEVEMPSEQLDIDSGYDEALRNLRDRLEVPQDPISESQINEDYYRAVRTYMVVIWMMANAILVMAITEIYGVKQVGTNFYLKFLLWAVAAISIFRAIGSSSYLILQLIHTVMEGKVKLKYDWKDRFQPSWKRQLKKSQGTGSGM